MRSVRVRVQAEKSNLRSTWGLDVRGVTGITIAEPGREVFLAKLAGCLHVSAEEGNASATRARQSAGGSAPFHWY